MAAVAFGSSRCGGDRSMASSVTLKSPSMMSGLRSL